MRSTGIRWDLPSGFGTLPGTTVRVDDILQPGDDHHDDDGGSSSGPWYYSGGEWRETNIRENEGLVLRQNTLTLGLSRPNKYKLV